MGFFLEGSGRSRFHVGSMALQTVMVIFFGECSFPPLVEIRESPEFHDLMREDKAHWPRCLLWHGWLPMLSGVNSASPWAADASESAGYLVEVALGRYSSDLLAVWRPTDEYDEVEAASLMPDHPNVWTDGSLDGSLVLDRITGVFSSGAGFFAHQTEDCWSGRRWGDVDRVRPEGEIQSCRGFCSVPGPLQSVQRAEMCCVILALQSFFAVHSGDDNLGVIRHVVRLLDGHHGSLPLELVKDGDLLLLIERMLFLRGHVTVRITHVKGHADQGMVLGCRVGEMNRLRNNAADDAADFGRRRVGNAVIDARRNLSGVCNRWYPVLLDLHRFFIAISRAVFTHDGSDGTVPDPLVWSAGALPKRRRLVHTVLDRAFLPGPLGVWDSEWVNVPASAICADVVAHWPCSTGILIRCWLFKVPCIGLQVVWILGLVVSHMLSCLFFVSFGLVRGCLWRSHLLPGRPISVSAVPFGPGIDIWRSCRFIGATMRSLCLLPGGFGRFVPCSIGANHYSLRHIGWEKCGHGLTSEPRESASGAFF